MGLKRKIATSVAVLMLTTGLAQAADIWVGLSGNKYDVPHYDDTNVGFHIGVGQQNILDNNWMYGGAAEFVYTNVNGKDGYGDSDAYEFVGELQGGYHWAPQSNIYAIVGVKYVDFDDTDATGFGGGAGVDYKYNDQWGAAIEYKVYNLDFDSSSGLGNENQYTTEFKLTYSF